MTLHTLLRITVYDCVGHSADRSDYSHRRKGQFFLGRSGAEPALPENFFDSAPKKTAMLMRPNSMLSTN